ncbi:MAG: DUF4331 family protein [Polyangiaceae bacterium]|nr:DUF4331 family protein [Polyangiaceae bacterium]
MKRPLLMTGLVAVLATATSGAWAADHTDSPAAVADPAADITDLYTWMESDASKINLVMNVVPGATNTSSFSTSVIYTFHLTNPQTSDPSVLTSYMVMCQFTSNSSIQCWLEGPNGTIDYVSGDPTPSAGLDSTNGDMKVFAGLRNDPFFFNLDGFSDAIGTVKTAAPTLPMSSVAGCPQVDATTSDALVGMLGGTVNGTMPAADKFLGGDVMSIVVQLNKTPVTAAGDELRVWASTNQVGN